MAESLVRVAIVPEYPGLVVSADGRIQGPSGKWLKMWQDKDGYLTFNVYWNGGSKPLNLKAHVVVCTVFHGPRPSDRPEVRHVNGNPADNRASNLRWATPAENARDKLRHGTHNRGTRHNMAKLTEDQVTEIRTLRDSGETCRSLGSRYGVHPATVSDICRRRIWRHLP